MNLPRPRSIASIALLASASLLIPLTATAQGAYPNRPIHLIVPLAAGSAVDVAARIVAQQMSASMGQSLVVENLPGAAGIVAKAWSVNAPGLSIA